MPFDIESARKEGKKDEEIASYLGSKLGFDVDTALKEGKTHTQIADYLSTHDAPPTVPATPEQKSIPGLLWQGVKNIPESGVRTVKGLAGMVTHPFQTAEAVGGYVGNIGRAGLEQLFGEPVDPEAEAAVKSYAEPVRKTIEDPLGTPRRALEWTSENPVEAGLMVSGGLGTAGAVLKKMGVLPKVAEVATTAAKITNPFYVPTKTGEKLFNKFAATPTLRESVEEGMKKGARYAFKGKGTPAMTEKYVQNAESAVSDIIANKDKLEFRLPSGATEKGRLPSTVGEFDQVIADRMVDLWGKSSGLTKIAEGKGAMVKPTQLVKELRDIANTKIVIDTRSGLAKEANNLATRIENRIKKGGYSPVEVEREIAALNNELDSFYSTPGFKDETFARLKALQANHFRKGLDDAVSSLTGENYQALKNQYGSYRAIQDDVHKRALVDARKLEKGFFDMSNIFSSYHILHGATTLNIPTMAAGAGARVLSWWYKLRNSPSRAVNEMFQNAERAIGIEKPPGYFDIGEINRRRGMTPLGEVPPPATGIEWTPEMGPVPSTPGTPNLPVPFEPRRTGLPVPTGEGFGVESVRQPRLDWWRGEGAKGVGPIPQGEGLARPALPSSLGFISREGAGSTAPEGKRRAQMLSAKREKWGSRNTLSDVEFSKEVALAKDALFKGADPKKVREFFKTRTGLEYPE